MCVYARIRCRIEGTQWPDTVFLTEFPFGGCGVQSLSRLKPLFALGWYVLAVVLVNGLMGVVWIWPVWDILARIGWWMTPNRALPFFWRGGYVHPFPGDDPSQWIALPGILLIWAICLFAVHAVIILVVVLIHRFRGRPAYLKSVRASFGALLYHEARSIWWILPATLGLFLLAEPVIDILNRCSINWVFYLSYTWLNWIGFVLLAGMHASASLRHRILSQVTEDELRCADCGYLLFGLQTRRCPECGDESLLDGVPRYRLGRQRPRPLARVSVTWPLLWVVPLIFVVAVLHSFWRMPPSSWRAWVQNSSLQALQSWSILPSYWWYPPTAWPIYQVQTGTVLICEDPNRVMAIEVEWSAKTNYAFTVAQWPPPQFKQGDPPAQTHIMEIDPSTLRLFTWRDTELGFSFLVAPAGSERERIINIYFDDPVHVWGFRKDEAPARMQHVMAAFTAIQVAHADPNQATDQ